jgi:hypothetical protein
VVGARAYLNDQSGDLSVTATSSSNALIIQTAVCLIQAGKPFNQLLAKHSLKNTITQAESTLGIEVAIWSAGELESRA